MMGFLGYFFRSSIVEKLNRNSAFIIFLVHFFTWKHHHLLLSLQSQTLQLCRRNTSNFCINTPEENQRCGFSRCSNLSCSDTFPAVPSHCNFADCLSYCNFHSKIRCFLLQGAWHLSTSWLKISSPCASLPCHWFTS